MHAQIMGSSHWLTMKNNSLRQKVVQKCSAPSSSKHQTELDETSNVFERVNKSDCKFQGRHHGGVEMDE